ncbi:hypothetical protein [Microbispora sp. H10836]|uniref:hypothetical protein n=1 Tax=Microbispora sp. H10836 TaxID=2729106 RepID=UPI0014759C81|nr:hypothetical protein [Microbispora sp. H10836]
MCPRPYASRLIGRAGLVAVPMAVLLTACGTPQPEVRSRPAAPGGPATATVPVAASPSPAPSVVRAADDPQACRDADCEVEVRPGDRLRLDRKTGLDVITVVSVDRGEVRLRFEAGGGTFRVEGMNTDVSQDCVNGRCRTDGGLTLAMGRPGRIGDIRLRLASVAPDHAVLVLAPS